MSAISENDVGVEDPQVKVARSSPNNYMSGYSGYQKSSNYQEPEIELNGGYLQSSEQIYNKTMARQAKIDRKPSGSKKSHQTLKTGLILAAVFIVILLMLMCLAQFAWLATLSQQMAEVESDNAELRILLNEEGQTNDLQDNSHSDERVNFGSLEQRIQKNITHVIEEIDSVMETVRGLESDVQNISSRVNYMHSVKGFKMTADGKTAADLLAEVGAFNASRYIADYGYIIIQQRTSTSLSFDRNITEYQRGFSDSENFWIGLDILHNLTSKYKWNLRIEATASSTGLLAVGEYDNFGVASADENYRFNIGNHS